MEGKCVHCGTVIEQNPGDLWPTHVITGRPACELYATFPAADQSQHFE